MEIGYGWRGTRRCTHRYWGDFDLAATHGARLRTWSMKCSYAVVEQRVVLDTATNIEGVVLATAECAVEASREREGRDGGKKARDVERGKRKDGTGAGEWMSELSVSKAYN
ncbi:uncharacterized protein FOMMEDRAFT_154481 [Fomitiporia mediterranea MF3/22]|uniref:uncharacterized protein n=1 Tax=Fomitiporia mediterranea (strain MF3/22) TaxID=694068 RepID=UPI0004409C11|nr:uncharacterized protein FOMMEDRAFT_154481 [Fomitiporia mediterranea MF3/22]EJD05255.1 hypothetical protein FOMMEDRAFT_154481 [Fomitiporia mediterranea MF3/22]